MNNLDLGDLNLVPIVLNSQLSLTAASYGIRFSKATVAQLGQPRWVAVFIDAKKKQLIIKATNSSDPLRNKFLNPKKKDKSVTWNSSDLKNRLMSLMNWNLKKTSYHVAGDAYFEQKAVVFDLKKAETK